MKQNRKRQKERKRQGRKTALALLLLVLVFVQTNTAFAQEKTKADAGKQAEAELSENDLYSTGAVLMDAETGRILYGKKEDTFLAMASTTKIMTCILALELSDPKEEISFSAYAASMPKVKQYAKAGETFYLEDLLIAMMLESYNDTAAAIAEYLGRIYGGAGEEADSRTCVQAFARLMNQKAKDLGCTRTVFVTPNGLDETVEIKNDAVEMTSYSHGTTAAELARIMAYCVGGSPKAAEFLRITQVPSHRFTSLSGKAYSCVNHNLFLQMMEGAESGKTGFTNKAGYCYVGSLKRGEHHLVIALLGCSWPNRKNDKWKDAKTLYQYGLKHYGYAKTQDLLEGFAENRTVSVTGGCTPELTDRVCIPVEEIRIEGRDGILLCGTDEIVRELSCPKVLEAPVGKGEMIGEVRYTMDGILLYRGALLAGENVEKRSFLWSLKTVAAAFLIKS